MKDVKDSKLVDSFAILYLCNLRVTEKLLNWLNCILHNQGALQETKASSEFAFWHNVIDCQEAIRFVACYFLRFYDRLLLFLFLFIDLLTSKGINYNQEMILPFPM